MPTFSSLNAAVRQKRYERVQQSQRLFKNAHE